MKKETERQRGGERDRDRETGRQRERESVADVICSISSPVLRTFCDYDPEYQLKRRIY